MGGAVVEWLPPMRRLAVRFGIVLWVCGWCRRAFRVVAAGLRYGAQARELLGRWRGRAWMRASRQRVINRHVTRRAVAPKYGLSIGERWCGRSPR